MPDGAPFGLRTVEGRQLVVALAIDNPASAMIAATLVEQFGCRALAAAGGEPVIQLVMRDSAIDLVIVDLALRAMDGIAAAELIHAVGGRREIPIVALADRRSDLAGRGRAAGFASTVMKPFSPRELYAALRAALVRSRVRALS
jgi:CheY-like chemotaxis protein